MRYKKQILFLFALLLSPVVLADTTRLIAVQGESRVELEPNRAILALEIKQTRNTLDEARQGVSATLKDVVNILKKNGIAEKNIEKTRLWQGPNYEWESNKQVLKGYNASVQLKVTLDDMQQLAMLVDDLAKIHDTTLQNSAFTRSDQEALEAGQRKLALLNAKQKATDMLAVYNEKLGAVLTIRDANSSPPIVYEKMEMRAMTASMADAAAEPAAWGKVTISAIVQVEFAIE